jgi:hypothetical protein
MRPLYMLLALMYMLLALTAARPSIVCDPHEPASIAMYSRDGAGDGYN